MSDFTFTDSNFKIEALEIKMPVIVDFWAPWCAPCRIVSPIIEELAEEYAGKVKVGKVNVDENNQTASQYEIMSIPSIVFLRSNEKMYFVRC